MCTGRKCKGIEHDVFKNSILYHSKEEQKKSPYYRKQIKKTEHRLRGAQLQYRCYKENNHRTKRSNSN